MTGANPQEKPAPILCIIGLPDSRQITVSGVGADGKMIQLWDGNSDFHNHLSAKFTKDYLSITASDDPSKKIQKPAVILNCINDADIASKSLQIAAHITESITQKWPDVAVFNHPAAIANTTRDRVYNLYRNLPGLYIPNAIKAAPASVQDVMILAKSEIGFPFLIRPCGTHQGEGLQRINNESETHLLEAYAYDGRNYYLTEYVDYKSPNNLYHKARLIMLGGAILPRHYMTGTDWFVHGNLHEEYMANNDAAKKAEEHFIEHFSTMINAEALDSLREIYHRSGLDYLGFDFAIRPDGSLLIFEINPAQNSFLKLNFSTFPYMQHVRDNLIAALNECIAGKIHAKKVELI